ncbi:hypothetical protein BJF82_00030 [Kytococcus sp. CUA-901]|nr:hypothetical protein BJF82_00030 [Kytococcus sp. CUA-901]
MGASAGPMGTTPASSISARVAVIPSMPWSRVWLFAVLQASMPASASASACSWGVLNTAILLLFVSPVLSGERGVSWLQIVTSPPASHGLTGANMGEKS